MNFSCTWTRLLLAVSLGNSAQGQYLRESAQRLRHFDNHDPSTFQFGGQNPKAAELFADLANDPSAPIDEEGKMIDEENAAEQEAFQALLETMAKVGTRSMPPTEPPTASTMPSDVPSSVPSPAPNTTFTELEDPTVAPTVVPSAIPTVSIAPTASPTLHPTLPAGETATPTTTPTKGPTAAPTTLAPTNLPSAMPTVSVQPSDAPSKVPTIAPTTSTPTSAPTLANCGISAQVRAERILEILENAVVDSSILANLGSPQGLATEWILNQDEAVICPDDPKFLQRWVLAVIYFSTNGDQWVQCSANPAATDDCGNVLPFLGGTRFLSAGTECDWAGISCIDGCVTEIEFEENNLVGTIPTEIGLLSDLAVWGMERGGLTSTIPTEVGMLTKLIFLDLDFNALTGSLPDELFTLTDLTQLGTCISVPGDL